MASPLQALVLRAMIYEIAERYSFEMIRITDEVA